MDYSNGYKFRTVHGAGHMVPSTQPERAAALLKDFLMKDNHDRNKKKYENNFLNLFNK